MGLTVEAFAGDFSWHNSYILLVYYSSTWMLMGSTWGMARLDICLLFLIPVFPIGSRLKSNIIWKLYICNRWSVIVNDNYFSKLPAYKSIYRCVSLQGLGLIYFGLRFRPSSTFTIDPPEDLVSAFDLAACVGLVTGIVGTYVYAPKIAKGIS